MTGAASSKNPSAARAALALAVADRVPKDLLIDGVWERADERFAVEDPATGQVIAMVADGSAAAGHAGLSAAAQAAPRWAAAPPDERAAVLATAAGELRERADELAALITLEMGKPFAESLAEVAYAASFFAWYAEEARRIMGTTTTAPLGGADLLTLRRPVGPCLLITPWNFPLAMPARKLAPALAAGCTAVVKPSELTPLSTLALGDVLVRAGAPAGVVNIVPTSDAPALVAPLLSDTRLRKLSFTGSTGVGKHLMAHAADNVLRLSLELGGNAPFLVCADADLDAAVEGALVAKMRNGGQACTAANRFLVERPVAAEFARRLAERFDALAVGAGLEVGTDVGPLVEEAAARKVQELVQQAVDVGARPVTGERTTPLPRPTFVAPTVLADVPPEADLLRTEIFGPVAPVIAVDGVEEAIRQANDTPFGLAAYVYTGDLAAAHAVITRLESGMVAVNGGSVSDVAAPFGGVKWSGLGREGAAMGLDEFLEVHAVTLNHPR